MPHHPIRLCCPNSLEVQKCCTIFTRPLGVLNWVRDHDVIGLQDMDMQQWDSGSCLSGTTSKTEENILVAIFGPRTEHLISQIHLPLCPLPVAPYLLHASPQKSPPPPLNFHMSSVASVLTLKTSVRESLQMQHKNRCKLATLLHMFSSYARSWLLHNAYSLTQARVTPSWIVSDYSGTPP